MSKGSWKRPCATTREEQELRHKYATTKMTFDQFEIEYKKLMKRGLIRRNGRALK